MRLAILLSTVAAAVATSSKNLHEEIIRSSLPEVTGGSLCSDFSCCNISKSESCPLSAMPKDQNTLVLPGGETRCIYSYSTPFAFQVIPGDTDKLLVYFQGGGACWDQYSTNAGLCTTDCVPQKPLGVFDRSEPLNQFRSHTVVHIMYCSGDIHSGNVVRSYTDSAGVPITQKGLANTQAVLDWMIAQQSSGAIAPVLSEIAIMGCSAGSIGTQVWSNQILSDLKWKKAAVLPDSYAGIFPPGTQGPLVYEYGLCSSYILTDDMRKQCNDQQLTLQAITGDFMNRWTNVPYSFIQSKVDSVQISFYVSVAISFNKSAIYTPTQYYKDVNAVFAAYNADHSNFLTYLLDGSQHCFSPYAWYFTADGSGANKAAAAAAPTNKAGDNYDDLKLHEWTEKMPLDSQQSINSECLGSVAGNAPDNNYCSSSVVPKTFVENWN